jgi:hypothetical protein
MPSYDAQLTLRDARAAYFEANGFGEDGGYAKRWVKLEIGRISLFFPNFQSRVRAVKFHDLDHLLTGYETDVVGESEISAYEIASGCGSYSAAWGLNLSAFFTGALIWPRRVFAAYRRGLRCQSLYHEKFSDALLDERVGSAQDRLGLDAAPLGAIRLGERVGFAGWWLVSASLSLAMLGLLAAPFYGLSLLLF